MKKIKQFKKAQELLNYFNTTYLALHGSYERLFWISYMGDHSVDSKMNLALSKRGTFRSNKHHAELVQLFLKKAKGDEKKRLHSWKLFFEKYQTPSHVLPIKNKIAEIESRIRKNRAERTEGYTDPQTGNFIQASELKMRTMMRTHPDELIRKACFDAMENLAVDNLDLYVELINVRNEFARALGYEDFYSYKTAIDEGMTKKELFSLFDAIYDKTKFAFLEIKKLERKQPGINKPWNFSFMMSGDFVKEEDPYFQFDEALMRWGRSFAALGIDFKGGKLTLDLLDRKGKWNNGFCHWPMLVHFEKGKRIPGASNFTCNTIYGQVGSGIQGIHTLFHEGGHAAHLLNSTEKDVAVNQEYPPMSTAWAETQSMFCDSIMSSIEWKTRYAYNREGNAYPFDLFKRKLEKVFPLIPLELMGILFVSNYEKDIYEANNLTKEKVLEIAQRNYKKYTGYTVSSHSILNVPHLYGFESSASYHGYGLAELAVAQWRDYFFKKYGYIVDNNKIGKEMEKVWKLGATKTFKEFVILATKKKLSASSFIKSVTLSLPQHLKRAQKKIERLKKVPYYTQRIDLNATIVMVHGTKKIADNKKGFEVMTQKYKRWLNEEIKK